MFQHFPVQIAGITTNRGKLQVKQTVQPQIIEVPTDAGGYPLLGLGDPGSIILLVAPAGDEAFLQMKEGALKTDNNLVTAAARNLASRVEKNRNRIGTDALAVMEMKYGNKIVAPDIVIDPLLQFNILAFGYQGAALEPQAFTLVQYSDAADPASIDALLLVYQPVLNRIEKEAMRQMPQPAGNATLLKQVEGSFIKDVGKAVNKAANDVGHAVVNTADDVGKAVVNTANDAGQAAAITAEATNVAIETLVGVNAKDVANDAQNGNQAAVMNDLATVGPNRAQDQVMEAAEAEGETDATLAVATEETTEFAIIGAPAREQALKAMPAQRSQGILANEPNVDELLEYRFSIFASKV